MSDATSESLETNGPRGLTGAHLMTCEDFFLEHAENRDVCKVLQGMPHNEVLAFEDQKASRHSPEPVQNDELLWRQMLNPTHFDPVKNELKITAFSDVSSMGGSVNRAAHIDKNDLIAAAEKRAEAINARGKPPVVELHELVCLNCSDVRAIRTSLADGVDRQAFIVVDTALEHDISHADICQVVSGTATGRSVRSALLELANQYLSKLV